eukprot:SAG31_NODE_11428_length_1031_cov_4.413090_2_plen_185_part_00
MTATATVRIRIRMHPARARTQRHTLPRLAPLLHQYLVLLGTDTALPPCPLCMPREVQAPSGTADAVERKRKMMFALVTVEVDEDLSDDVLGNMIEGGLDYGWGAGARPNNPVYYAGTITKVTPTRCKVLFDTDQSEWDLKRYGEEAQLIRKITEKKKKKKKKKKSRKNPYKISKVAPPDFDDDL